MITGYFLDMQRVIKEWARVLAKGARVAMVVDNVRFEGELIPVDLILSDMAEEEGFRVDEIIVARYKGNSSQQMGKYGRVPVRESITLWTRR
jgi:predicted MPP superfamily phosphohydrolase